MWVYHTFDMTELKLKPGETFSSERKLVNELRVRRASLGEVLRILESRR